MQEENKGIRLEARGAGVPLWRIAQEMSISEPTLTRLLRKPLADKKETQIREIIQKISVARKEDL